MLDPERAVLVEGRDALGGRDELGACSVGRRVDKLEDRLLGRAVVPGGQGSGGLSLGGCRAKEFESRSQGRKRCERAEHRAAA